MKKDKLFADIFVHLHSANLNDKRMKVEKELREYSGVVSVHFETDECRNAMIVTYDPAVVSSDALLEVIRNSYAGAERVAKMLLRVDGH